MEDHFTRHCAVPVAGRRKFPSARGEHRQNGQIAIGVRHLGDQLGEIHFAGGINVDFDIDFDFPRQVAVRWNREPRIVEGGGGYIIRRRLRLPISGMLRRDPVTGSTLTWKDGTARIRLWSGPIVLKLPYYVPAAPAGWMEDRVQRAYHPRPNSV